MSPEPVYPDETPELGGRTHGAWRLYQAFAVAVGQLLGGDPSGEIHTFSEEKMKPTGYMHLLDASHITGDMV